MCVRNSNHTMQSSCCLNVCSFKTKALKFLSIWYNYFEWLDCSAMDSAFRKFRKMCLLIGKLEFIQPNNPKYPNKTRQRCTDLTLFNIFDGFLLDFLENVEKEQLFQELHTSHSTFSAGRHVWLALPEAARVTHSCWLVSALPQVFIMSLAPDRTPTASHRPSSWFSPCTAQSRLFVVPVPSDLSSAASTPRGCGRLWPVGPLLSSRLHPSPPSALPRQPHRLPVPVHCCLFYK